MSGCPASTLSISPGSTRKPRTLSCRSIAPGDLEVTARQPAPEIPGAVHPAAGDAARVGHEPFGGERGAAEVASGDAAAADVDLPGGPDRHRIQLLVENHDPRAADRPAHRHGCRFRRDRLRRGRRICGRQAGANVEQGRGDGRLGQPVGVQQPGPGRRPQRGAADLGVRRLAAGDHQPDTAQPLVAGSVSASSWCQYAGVRSSTVTRLRSDPAQQIGWRHGARRRQHQRRAAPSA